MMKDSCPGGRGSVVYSGAMPRHSSIRRCRGFTLIELLVVITIIAVLAGLLLPALSLVKNMAQQSVCGSNQRQLYLAIQGYANERQGLLPTQQMIAGEESGVDEYLDRVSKTGSGSFAANYLLEPSAKCPTLWKNVYPQLVTNFPAQGSSAVLSAVGTALGTVKPYGQYRINAVLGAVGTSGNNGLPPTGMPLNSTSSTAVSQSAIKAAAAMLFCGSGRWDSQGNWPDSRSIPQFAHRTSDQPQTSTLRTTSTNSPVYVLETGRTNVCFADGHVESRTARKNTTASDFSDKEVPLCYFKPVAETPCPVADFWGVQ